MPFRVKKQLSRPIAPGLGPVVAFRFVAHAQTVQREFDDVLIKVFLDSVPLDQR